MAQFKVYFDESGPFALVDTLEQVADLLKLGRKNTVSLPNYGSTSLPEPEAIQVLVKEINKNARKFLSHLANHPEGITGENFAEEIAIAPEKFGGVLGGASKIAKKHHLKFERIVVSELRNEGTRRFRWLCPGPLLLKYKEDFRARA